jgi:hypothetical protein
VRAQTTQPNRQKNIIKTRDHHSVRTKGNLGTSTRALNLNITCFLMLQIKVSKMKKKLWLAAAIIVIVLISVAVAVSYWQKPTVSYTSAFAKGVTLSPRSSDSADFHPILFFKRFQELFPKGNIVFCYVIFVCK